MTEKIETQISQTLDHWADQRHSVSMTAKCPDKLDDRIEQAGRHEFRYAKAFCKTLVEFNEAKVWAFGIALAANDVVNGDQGDDHRQHHLQGRRQQHQNRTDG